MYVLRAKGKPSPMETPLRDHKAVGRSLDSVLVVAGTEKEDWKELLGGGGWERGHTNEWI